VLGGFELGWRLKKGLDGGVSGGGRVIQRVLVGSDNSKAVRLEKWLDMQRLVCTYGERIRFGFS